MNKTNNKRKKESQQKIEEIFIDLIQMKQINEITVTDLCKKAKLNRSTFYANYIDIYDLANKIREKLELEVKEFFKEEMEKQYNSNNFLKLFYHIKSNQKLYKTYFKLDMDKSNSINEYDYNLYKYFYNDKYIDYHTNFFKAGLNAILKMWLDNGCKESPEEINKIIISEYKEKNINI